jgi:DNA-binding winged helix-turn-helix (wHTH) protein
VQYAFAGLTLDTDRYALRRGDEIVHVEPQVFDVLAYLVEPRRLGGDEGASCSTRCGATGS